MRVQSKDYGSCFPFLMAGLLILLGTLAWWIWRAKKLSDAVVVAHADLRSISSSLSAYAVDNAGFPTSGQGLDALLRPSTVPPLPKNWRGPYGVRLPPNDPWGNPFVYRSPGLRNPKGYDLFSVGPDGTPGTQDDIDR